MTNSQIDSPKPWSAKVAPFFQAISCAAAFWSVLAVGLHLWPFEGRHALETRAPATLGILLWTPIAMAALLSSRTRQLTVGHLPDVSIWAFLVIAAASVSFSPRMGQSAASLAKLALMYVGAFTLFGVACSREAWANRLCKAAMASACIAMIAAVAWRLWGREGFGFFSNPYKYGTATVIVFTLGIVHLASRAGIGGWLVVPATGLAAVTTVSLGGLCGIVIGLVAGMLVLKHRQARLRLAICLVVMVAVLAVCWQTPVYSHLRQDVRIGEPNGRDLRQRYIEWQAQLNLLQVRPVAGTGLGCVNDYRSMFYGRLPKLNTLEPFDRNGWLLVAAETGVFGLAAFLWLIVRAGRKAWRTARVSGPRADQAAAAFAALVAACAAGTFSSVNYNGVLNAFVLILALAHHAARTSPRQGPEVQGDVGTVLPTQAAATPAESLAFNE